ncbi:MAG: hypothetical protein IH897_16830, partial [Planctomycetes bacterium]|nr:hypothetical protein [Planctomycetota bacterium]
QVAASVGVMLLLSMAFGWPTELAVLLGFVVALSSTAVAIKILESIGELRTRSGRITVGVLIGTLIGAMTSLTRWMTFAYGGTEVCKDARRHPSRAACCRDWRTMNT